MLKKLILPKNLKKKIKIKFKLKHLVAVPK